MAFAIDSKKIAKNTVMLYIRLGITMVISFFTARVTLQQLGVDDYGLNNLVGSVVMMFSFINGSMGTAVQRFYNIEIGKGNEQRLGRVFGVGLYLHILVAIITFLLAELFAIFFLGKLNIPPDRMMAAHIIFQISVISLALSIINVPYAALLRSREMFSQTAVVDIFQAVLRLGVLYLLVTLPFDKLITLSVLNFFITLFYVGTLFVLARRFNETHYRPKRDKELIRQMLSFISMLLVTVLAELLNTKGLVLLINLYFGLAINAAYAIAVQIQHIVSGFVINFKQSVVPQMVSAYGANDKKSMFKLIDTGTKITFVLLIMLSMPIMFCSQWMLQVWLGEPPKYAAELVVLMMININISSFTYFLYQGVHAAGRIARQQMWMSGAYIVNILLVYVVFVLGFDFYSALYVTILVSLFRASVNVYYANRCFGYPVLHFLKNIVSGCLVVVIASAALGMMVKNTIPASVLREIVTCITLVLFIPIFSYIIILDKSERAYVMAFAHKATNKIKK